MLAYRTDVPANGYEPAIRLQGFLLGVELDIFLRIDNVTFPCSFCYVAVRR
jgi:hypothetical protein